ncbi:metal ABC transporter substrate-binding protein [Pygmaiobacter massiliensis]|uniref:metal ABC transporter substrate-binding protein n=1 Tax=Pygmaiobacter massiliensis TaxID=1917873 RepID=UPI00289C630C|nr:metal ABC transporter substrate-binding protein [Pygmaiobacter massiliensis]
MKRILAFSLAALLALSLSACGSTDPVETKKEKLTIVTTNFPPYDFVRQIGGEAVEVTMLLKPGAESHSYEPTPKDIKAVQNADLFIYTGSENDVWVEDILSSLGGEKPDTLKLLDCVPTVEEELVEGMEAEHDHDEGESDTHTKSDAHDEEEHNEHEIDEHVWTSPKNAILITEKISQEMQQRDPNHAETYAKNAAAYLEKLNALDSELTEVTTHAKRKTILFGDRFPFRYLADAYGLNYFAAFSGCSSETEPDASTVAFLVDKVKAEQLPVVFTIELSNGKIADSICDATGARKLTLHSCHNLTKDEWERGETYLSIMEQNVKQLKEALN